MKSVKRSVRENVKKLANFILPISIVLIIVVIFNVYGKARSPYYIESRIKSCYGYRSEVNWSGDITISYYLSEERANEVNVGLVRAYTNVYSAADDEWYGQLSLANSRYYNRVKLTKAEICLIYDYVNCVLDRNGSTYTVKGVSRTISGSGRSESRWGLRENIFVMMVLFMYYIRTAMPVWIFILFFAVLTFSADKALFENRRKSIIFILYSAGLLIMLNVVSMLMFSIIKKFFSYSGFSDLSGVNIIEAAAFITAETALIGALAENDKRRERILYMIPAVLIIILQAGFYFKINADEVKFIYGDMKSYVLENNKFLPFHLPIAESLFSVYDDELYLLLGFTSILGSLRELMLGSCGLFPFYKRLFSFTVFMCMGFALYFFFGCLSKRSFEENIARSSIYAFGTAFLPCLTSYIFQYMFL